MGRPSNYLVQCRCGGFVPLLIQAKKMGDGRFYYVHPDRRGEVRCRHAEYFNPDVDNIADLKEMFPDISLKEVAPVKAAPDEMPEQAEDVPVDISDSLPAEEKEGGSSGFGFFN